MRQDHVMRCLERPQEEMDLSRNCGDICSSVARRADNIDRDNDIQDLQTGGTNFSTSKNKGSCSNIVDTSKKRPLMEISEYDIMYIDDKDPDFASPVPRKKSPKRPKGVGLKTFQGTLSVDNKGKMSVNKPIIETAGNIESAVKVAPISKNMS